MLKRIAIGVIAPAIAAATGMTALAWRPSLAAIDPPAPTTFPGDLIAKGEVLRQNAPPTHSSRSDATFAAANLKRCFHGKRSSEYMYIQREYCMQKRQANAARLFLNRTSGHTAGSSQSIGIGGAGWLLRATSYPNSDYDNDGDCALRLRRIRATVIDQYPADQWCSIRFAYLRKTARG